MHQPPPNFFYFILTIIFWGKCRNGLVPRRDHVGVLSCAHEPRSRCQMEEARDCAAVQHPPAAQAGPPSPPFFSCPVSPNLTRMLVQKNKLDIPTYLCACSTLRSPSSCSSSCSPSGDRRSKGTRLLPRTYTSYRSMGPAGISWTMTCWIGHG